MSLPAPLVMLVLTVTLVASACGADEAQDPNDDAGNNATSGTGGSSGSDGASGQANTSGRAGGSGSGDTPAIDGGASNMGDSGGTSGGQVLVMDAGEAGTGGSGGTTGTSGTGGVTGTGGKSGADAGSGDCPAGLPGPALVNVPAPAESAVSSYCMDATEVSNAQYGAFVAASVATSGQDEACAWNESYAPAEGWPATDKDDHPVAYVDWCDAYAYCRWAGKHLCGKIGGGPTRFAFDYDDATVSEWFNACSGGGTSAYPYGSEYDGTACVGIDYEQVGYQPALDVARQVGRATTCQGGYRGLYDLSGNVWEWENSCRGESATDECRLRGGAYANETVTLECATSNDRERSSVAASVGFRCCADAEPEN